MVIILVALLVLGPEQLPKAMRSFGNVMTQVRKVSGGFQAELKSVMDSVTDGIDPTKPSSATKPSTPTTPVTPVTTAGDDKPHSAPAGRAGVEPEPEPGSAVEPEPGSAVEPSPVAEPVGVDPPAEAGSTADPERQLVDRAAG